MGNLTCAVFDSIFYLLCLQQRNPGCTGCLSSGFAWAESVLALTVWSTCGCVCPFVMPGTSVSQSGSIKSQLVDVFKSS